MPAFFDQRKIVAFLTGVSPFASLSQVDLASLAKDFRLRKYKKNDTIFHQQDLSRTMYVVMNGKLKIFHISLRGNETTVTILASCQIFGEFAAIDDKPRSATAKALEDCLLLELTQDRLLYHMRTIPDLALGMCRLLVDKARWTSQFAHLIIQCDAPGRLLYLLLHYNEQFGREIETGKRYELDLGLNQLELASMCGVRRERVSSILQHWRKDGLVEYSHGGRFVILNLSRVREELQQQLMGDQEDILVPWS